MLLQRWLHDEVYDGFEGSGFLGGGQGEEAVAAAGVGFASGMKAGEAVGEDLDAAGLGEAEVVSFWEDCLEDAALIPAGAVVVGAAVQEVGLFDDVVGQVVKVAGDAEPWVGQAFADFKSGPDDGDGGGPLVGDGLHVADAVDDVGFEVVVGVVAKGEGSGHDREGLHFGFDEVDAAGGFDEVGEVGGDADADEGDAVVGLGGEQIAQEGDGVWGVGVGFEVVRVVAGLDGFEVTAFAVLGLGVAGDADGEIGATVEGVLGVDEGDRERVIFGNGNAQELASAAVSEAVAHGEGKHVVHVASDVGVENDLGFFSGGEEVTTEGTEEHREEDEEAHLEVGGRGRVRRGECGGRR